MEIKKPNDIFVAVLQKPDVNVFDLAKSQFVPNNTQLLSEDEYKKSGNVQKMFTGEDGKFNDQMFKQAYQKAALLYNDLDNDTILANALEWDPYDFTSPKDSKKLDIKPTILKDINPFKNTYSRTGINSVDVSDLSFRELAQQGKIFDVTKNEWLDKSANDLGLLGSWFNDTLVYAQWDEEGDHKDPITGKKIKHNKGDWKYDDDGNLFIETLGDREIFGRQIVNPTDLITTEGSWFNKLDYFDSDGRDKSVVGTTMKLATEIAPYLIPGFNVYYGGAKMAMGLAYVLPTFYKAGEALFLGESEKGNETELWKAMNSTQGFLSKYNVRSNSDSAQASMFNYEQLGGMVSDIFSQIYEQRAAAKMSTLFYKSNETELLKNLSNKTQKVLEDVAKSDQLSGIVRSKEQYEKIAKIAYEKLGSVSKLDSKRSQLAKSLSLGYMAMTQSADVYGEAIAGGYDARTAGFAALLAASGQYALMSNNQMGDWFLDKAVGYSTGASKAGIRKVINETLEEIQEGVKELEVNKTVGKKILGSVFVKTKDRLKNLLTTPKVIAESELRENLTKNAMIEGIEEVSEEFAIDAAKGIVDIMGALGYTAKQGSFGGIDNILSKNGFERYLSSLVGGAIGGGLFEVERSVISPILSGQSLNLSTDYNLIQLVANGKSKELIAEINKQKSVYGSTTLSPVAANIDGKEVFLTADGMTQADVIANVAIQKIEHLEKMLNSEGLKLNDDEVVTKAIMDEIRINDMKVHKTDTFIISDFTQLVRELNIAKTQLEQDEKNPESLKKFNLAKKQLEELLTGEKSEYYHGLSLFVLNKNLHGAFINLTVEDFVKTKYNKDFYSVSESEQKEYTNEFESIKDSSKDDSKNRMKAMYDKFLEINKDFSKPIAEYDKDGYATLRKRFLSNLKNKPESLNLTNLYQDYIKLHTINSELLKGGYRANGFDSETDPSLGRFLMDAGLIELGLSVSQSNELKKKALDEVAATLGIEKLEGEEDEAFYQKVYSISNTSKDPNILEIKERLLKDLTTISKDVADNEKETIIAQIDSVGIPTGDLDLITIQNLLDKLNLNKDKEIDLLSKQFPKIGPETSMEDIQKGVELSDVINKLSDPFEIKIKGLSRIAVNKENLMSELGQIFTNKTVRLYSGVINLAESGVTNEEILNFINNNVDTNEELGLADYLESILQGEQVTVEALENAYIEYLKQYQSSIDFSTMSSENIPKSLFEKHDPNVHKEENHLIFTDNNKELNPRRQLLLKYAEQVIASGEDMDEETLTELGKELKSIETKINEAPISASIGNLEDYYNNNFGTFDEELNKLGYQDYIRIKKVFEYKNKKINSFLKKLNDFQISLFGKDTPITMFTLLQDTMNEFQEQESPSEFKRNDIQLEQIERALSTLKMVKSVTSAMIATSPDGTFSENNLYGYNVMLNKASEKEGGLGEYEVISSESADQIRRDVKVIEEKLNYLKTLAEANSGSLIGEQEKIKDAILNSLYTSFINNSKFSAKNLTINGKPLLSENDILEVSSYANKEKQVIELEKRIYDNFENASSDDLTIKLNEIFNQFKEGEENFAKSIIDGQDSNLTKTLSELTKKDWYFYLHSILALDSHTFTVNYKNLLKNELNLEGSKENPKAPFFSQQFVLRQEMAYLNGDRGKKVTAHSIEFIQPSAYELAKDTLVKENSELIKQGKTSDVQNREPNEEEIIRATEKLRSFSIPYVYGVRGSGGTGKSAILGNFALRMAIDRKIPSNVLNIVASAPTEKTANILNNTIKTNVGHAINSQTFKEFLEGTLGDEYVRLKEEMQRIEKISTGDNSVKLEISIKGSGDGAYVLTKEYLESITAGKKLSGTSLVFIDEMTKLSTLDWQVINELAKTNNFYFIALGDDSQNGINIGKETFSLENVSFPTSVKLKSTIRAANVHKNDNNMSLEKLVGEVKSNIISGINTNSPFEIHYYDKTFLNGDKFVDALTVEDLRQLDQTKEIAVITNGGNLSESYKKLFAESGIVNYKIYPEEVQGEEFDQVIVLADIEKGTKYLTSKNLNTLLTRAKIATIIVGNNNILKDFNIKQISFGTTKEKFINKNDIVSYLEKRLSELEILSETLSENNNQPDIEKVGKLTIDTDSILQDLTIEGSSKDKNKIFSEKDPNKILSYSFFNNTGIYIDLKGESDTNGMGPSEFWSERENYKFTNEESSENTINIDSFREFVHTRGNTDLAGLFSTFTNAEISGKTVGEMFSEYVAFKNSVLFNAIEGSIDIPKLFGKQITYGKLVARVLTDTEYSQPYGKIASMHNVTGNIYTLGVFAEIEDENDPNKTKQVYITLAVLPDINTVKNKNAADVTKLETLYNKLDDARTEKEEVKIFVKASNIVLYSGVYIPKTSALPQPIQADLIPTMFPGATISEPKVFKGGKYINGELINEFSIKTIREEVDKYLPEGFDKTTLTDEYYKKMMFRPFVIVSFIKGHNKYSRLVILDAKRRKLNKLWDELSNLNKEIENPINKNSIPELRLQRASLMNKYQGWQIAHDFLKFVNAKYPSHLQSIIKTIVDFKAYQDFVSHSDWNTIPWEEAFISLNKAGFVHSFSELYKESGNIVKSVIGDRLISNPPVNIINPLFVFYEMMQKTGQNYNEFKTLFSDFVDDSASNGSDIFYNTIIGEANEGTDKNIGYLPKEILKNYQMGYVVEPNQLMIDMEGFIDESKEEQNKKKEKVVEKDKKVDLNYKGTSVSPIMTINFLNSKREQNQLTFNLPRIDYELGVENLNIQKYIDSLESAIYEKLLEDLVDMEGDYETFKAIDHLPKIDLITGLEIEPTTKTAESKIILESIQSALTRLDVQINNGEIKLISNNPTLNIVNSIISEWDRKNSQLKCTFN